MRPLAWLGLIPMALGAFFIWSAPFPQWRGSWGRRAKPENRVPVSFHGNVAWGFAAYAFGLNFLTIDHATLNRICSALYLLALIGLFVTARKDRQHWKSSKRPKR